MMRDDLQIWNDAFTTELASIRTLVMETLPSLLKREEEEEEEKNGDNMNKNADNNDYTVDAESQEQEQEHHTDVSTTMKQIKELIQSAKSTKRSLKVEIRLLVNDKQRKNYDLKLKSMEGELLMLQEIFTQLQQEHNENQRRRPRRNKREEEEEGLYLLSNGDNPQQQRNQQNHHHPIDVGTSMLNEATELQNKIEESLSVTKEIIEQTKDVGVSTLEELHTQRYAVQRIEKESDVVNDHLKTSDAVTRTFARRLATDKYIQCFATASFLALILLVLFVVYGGGSGGGAGGTGGTTVTAGGARAMLLRRG